MLKFLSFVASTTFILIAVPALAGSYQYIDAENLKQKLTTGAAVHMVDIQIKQEFNQHHIQGALPTYAYPVKSPNDRSKLDAVIGPLRDSLADVVVICPRGGGGAKRAYDYLQQQGISANRLFILEKGQASWPYPELLEKKI